MQKDTLVAYFINVRRVKPQAWYQALSSGASIVFDRSRARVQAKHNECQHYQHDIQSNPAAFETSETVSLELQTARRCAWTVGRGYRSLFSVPSRSGGASVAALLGLLRHDSSLQASTWMSCTHISLLYHRPSIMKLSEALTLLAKASMAQRCCFVTFLGLWFVKLVKMGACSATVSLSPPCKNDRSTRFTSQKLTTEHPRGLCS